MFIDVFDSFGSLLSRKHEENETERQKYDLGVSKLAEAKIMIKEMEIELNNLRPQLTTKSKEVEQTLRKLEVEKAEVEEIERKVDEESQVAKAEKYIADGIKNEC